MDHATFVRVLQSESSLANELTGHVDGQSTALIHQFCEVDAVHELHRQEVDLSRLLGIERRDDVRMNELRCRLDLAPETRDRLRTPQPFGLDDFQRDSPLHQPMLGFEHGSHPAATQRPNDAVARMLRQFRWHCWQTWLSGRVMRSFGVRTGCGERRCERSSRQVGFRDRFAQQTDVAVISGQFFERLTTFGTGSEVLLDCDRFVVTEPTRVKCRESIARRMCQRPVRHAAPENASWLCANAGRRKAASP